jgi:small-conductance mechanosensitive channel/CRP-like cAMP-binding protein
MSSAFSSANAAWAALVIVLLPALIIGVGELQERLRQRDSPYRSAVAIVRVWVLPLLAVWLLSRTLFDVESDDLVLRFVNSAVIIAVAAATLSALGVLVGRLSARPLRTGRRAVPRLVLAIPRLVVVLVAAWVLVATVWGVDLSAALTALGVTSLVISFALQDTLGGIASGFTLLADQPFGPGDWIESEGVEGRVIDINWRSTRIQNRDGDLVVIPNGQLANATIVNFDQPLRLHRVMVPVQIERTAPPTAAKAMLLDAANSTPGVLADPPAFAIVTNIADPVVDYQTYMWVDDYAIVPRVKADFSSLVWYLSYRHGVPLPNPAQDLYLFDGTQTAIDAQVSSADIRRALLDAPLLAELPDEVVDRLASASSLHSYQEGELLLDGPRRHDLFVLDQGRARLVLAADVYDVPGTSRTSSAAQGVRSDDLAVLELGAGDLFGLAGEVSDHAGAGKVVALTDCRVVRIPGDAAAAAVASADGFAEVLDQLAASRRRRCERVLRRTARDAG